MSVATADLLKALNTVWDASALDATFRALWDDPTDTGFEVLNDQEASPEQPFPYVVMGQPDSFTIVTQSNEGDFTTEDRDVTLAFNVHARAVSGDSRTAKEIAADLAEELMKIFGGHPTVNPEDLTLDNGHVLESIHQNDFCVRTGEDEYQWVVQYVFRVDVPVAL